MTPQQQKIKSLMDELMKLGVNIRGDWSQFDGRDLLQSLEIWLNKLGKITGIEPPQYYAATPKGTYESTKEKIRKCFEIDVSKQWESEN